MAAQQGRRRSRFVGQRKRSIAADVSTHVLIDGADIDNAEILA